MVKIIFECIKRPLMRLCFTMLALVAIINSALATTENFARDTTLYAMYYGSPAFSTLSIGDLSVFTMTSPLRNYEVPAIKNNIQLYYVHNDPVTIQQAFHAQVTVRCSSLVFTPIDCINNPGGTPSFSNAVNDITLWVDYHPSGGLTYKSKDLYAFNMVDLMQLSIVSASITDSTGTPVSTSLRNRIARRLKIRGEIEVERYYNFDFANTPTVNFINSVNNNTPSITIAWSSPDSLGEYYDFEWTHVNNVDNVNLEYNFIYNSTRVSVDKPEYTIPLTFEQGYLLWRVRGVGKVIEDCYTQFIPGKWSGPDAGLAAAYPTNARYIITSPNAFEQKKVWQYSANYAEEGKRKDAVKYIDGSFRERQNSVAIPSDLTTVTGDIFYDHEGRKAVTTLPVPNDDNSLYYQLQFNRNTSSDPYSRNDFDVDQSGTCPAPLPAVMDDNFGASRYYSSQNSLLGTSISTYRMHDYIPDAEDYPFVQTEYTPDNTGRIRRQGGAGLTFQIGNGHETKYYYSKPFQVELDRLFGNEVGFMEHYKKNYVIDPNGQISISYLNLSGKVIATALSGTNPESLDTIPGYTKAEVEKTVSLLPDTQFVELSPNEAAIYYSQDYVNTLRNNPHDFYYEMTGERLVDSCGTPFCANCIYDLQLSVSTECGDVIFSKSSVLGDSSISINCSDPVVTYDTSFTLTFDSIGNYTISKRLTVNRDALDYYTQLFMDTSECLPPYQAFLDSVMQYIDTTDCNVACEDCEAELAADGVDTSSIFYETLYNQCAEICKDPNWCDAAFFSMLDDVSPHGQYAGYHQSPDSPMYHITAQHEVLSVLNEYNLLPVRNIGLKLSAYNSAHPGNEVYNSGFKLNYRYPLLVGSNLFLPHYYKEDLVTIDSVILAGDTVPTAPQDMSANDFVKYFKPSWAYSLVIYHPEYAYHEWCDSNNAVNTIANISSNDLDALLLSTSEYSVAAADPRLNWLLEPYDTLDFMNNDPFFMPTGFPSGYLSGGRWFTIHMRAGINTNYRSTGKGIRELAYRTVNCRNGCTPPNYALGQSGDPNIQNQEWMVIKALYLSMKQYFRSQAAHSVAIFNSSYNGCIGDTFYPNSLSEIIRPDMRSLVIAETFYTGSTTWEYLDDPCDQLIFPLFRNKIPRYTEVSRSLSFSITDTSTGSVSQADIDGMYNYGINEFADDGCGCVDQLLTEVFLKTLLPMKDSLLNGNTVDIVNYQFLPEHIMDAVLGTHRGTGSGMYMTADTTHQDSIVISFGVHPDSASSCSLTLVADPLDTIDRVFDLTSVCCLNEVTTSPAFPGYTGDGLFSMEATINDSTTFTLYGNFSCISTHCFDDTVICTGNDNAVALSHLLTTWINSGSESPNINDYPYLPKVETLLESFGVDGTVSSTPFYSTFYRTNETSLLIGFSCNPNTINQWKADSLTTYVQSSTYYSIVDTMCKINTATFTPPQCLAVIDIDTIAQGGAILIEPLQNDYYPIGIDDIEIISGPDNGYLIEGIEDGTYVYVSTTVGTGMYIDTIVYEFDGEGDCNDTGLILIYCIRQSDLPDGYNTPPVAFDSVYNVTCRKGAMLSFADIASKCFDADGDNILLGGGSGVDEEIYILDPLTLTVVYIPPYGFTGQDTLFYFICDDGDPSLCDIGVILFDVTCGEDTCNLTAVFDTSYSSAQASCYVGKNLLTNDIGIGAHTGISIIKEPSYGTIEQVPGVKGAYTYHGNVLFNTVARDTVAYLLFDSLTGCYSYGGWFIIKDTVCRRTAPVAVNDTVYICLNDTSGVVDLLINDYDVDGDDLEIVGGDGLDHITSYYAGQLQFIADSGFVGIDTARYFVCEDVPGIALCDTGYIYIIVTDDCAETCEFAADDLYYEVPFNTMALLFPTIDEALIPYSSYGLVTVTENVEVAPDPELVFFINSTAGINSYDTVVYILVSADSMCIDTGYMYLTIREADSIGKHPPVVYNDTLYGCSGDTTDLLDPVLNDVDPDDDYMILLYVGEPDNGEVILLDETSEIMYVADSGFVGIDTAVYITCDIGEALPYLCDTGYIYFIIDDCEEGFMAKISNAPYTTPRNVITFADIKSRFNSDIAVSKSHLDKSTATIVYNDISGNSTSKVLFSNNTLLPQGITIAQLRPMPVAKQIEVRQIKQHVVANSFKGSLFKEKPLLITNKVAATTITAADRPLAKGKAKTTKRKKLKEEEQLLANSNNPQFVMVSPTPGGLDCDSCYMYLETIGIENISRNITTQYFDTATADPAAAGLADEDNYFIVHLYLPDEDDEDTLSRRVTLRGYSCCFPMVRCDTVHRPMPDKLRVDDLTGQPYPPNPNMANDDVTAKMQNAFDLEAFLAQLAIWDTLLSNTPVNLFNTAIDTAGNIASNLYPGSRTWSSSVHNVTETAYEYDSTVVTTTTWTELRGYIYGDTNVLRDTCFFVLRVDSFGFNFDNVILRDLTVLQNHAVNETSYEFIIIAQNQFDAHDIDTVFGYTSCIPLQPVSPCTGQPIGQELVNNGNFENGNTGFSSERAYDAACPIEHGQYTILFAGDACAFDNDTTVMNNYYHGYDHTYDDSSGHYMLLSDYAGLNTTVWKQIIPVQPNANYKFMYHYMLANRIVAGNQGIFKVRINNAVLDTRGAYNISGIWNSVTLNWFSGGATTATIEIVYEGSLGIGLDDISFMQRTCQPEGLWCADPPDFTMDYVNPCVQSLLDQAAAIAMKDYNDYRDSIRQDFRDRYIAKCLGAIEQYTMHYEDREHHYTLSYYDQAGNLIRTVPPQGVKLITDPGELAQVATHRSTGAGSPIHTGHFMSTYYEYSSLNQVRRQSTPDGGVTLYWYDMLGRVVASQNAKQAAVGSDVYSYTVYDKQARIIEVGELNAATAMTDAIAFDSTNYAAWLAGGTRSQITRTFYDDVAYPVAAARFKEGTQQNLRGRVASTSYSDFAGTAYNHATHYTYDVTGNVKELIQEQPMMALLNRQYHNIQYDYDLVSGKVNEVHYNPDSVDRFAHRYRYDDDNRIREVYTSHNGQIWQRDAKYYYYQHGPLARVELGDIKVQGTDYAYTLQGWLKGINSNSVYDDADNPLYHHGLHDIGHDAHVLSVNKWFGTDAMGYTLGYYNGDYKPVNTAFTTTYPATHFLAATPSGSGIMQARRELYNGNISHTAVAFLDNYEQKTATQGSAYRYDQLNRLKHSEVFTNLTDDVQNADYKWVLGGSSDTYKTSYTYDANGNITTLNRYGDASDMDQLSYTYQARNNKLDHVDDAVNPANYSVDIDDQNTANYTYDQIGNLITDAAENIGMIDWNVYGKIRVYAKGSDGGTFFGYDATGNRVLKTSIRGDTVLITQYIRDASGNIMATYLHTLDRFGTCGLVDGSYVCPYHAVVTLDELDIYGSSRLGTYEPAQNLIAKYDVMLGYKEFKVPVYDTVTNIGNLTIPETDTFSTHLGQKKYELTDHLGNVLTTISDRKLEIAYNDTLTNFTMPDVVASQDYYAFGMQMPGRIYQSDRYRFGFNGKEQDDDMKAEGNSLDFGARIYDPRLGRWLSVDPDFKNYPYQSVYVYADNNPIGLVDFEGRGSIDPLASNAVGLIPSYYLERRITANVGDFRWNKLYNGSIYEQRLNQQGFLFRNTTAIGKWYGAHNNALSQIMSNSFAPEHVEIAEARQSVIVQKSADDIGIQVTITNTLTTVILTKNVVTSVEVTTQITTYTSDIPSAGPIVAGDYPPDPEYLTFRMSAMEFGDEITQKSSIDKTSLQLQEAVKSQQIDYTYKEAANNATKGMGIMEKGMEDMRNSTTPYDKSSQNQGKLGPTPEIKK